VISVKLQRTLCRPYRSYPPARCHCRAHGRSGAYRTASPDRSTGCARHQYQGRRSAASCRRRRPAGSTRPGWRALRGPNRNGSRRGLDVVCRHRGTRSVHLPAADQPTIETHLVGAIGGRAICVKGIDQRRCCGHGRCCIARIHAGILSFAASLTLRQFREAVGAPAFAAHSVMYEEEAVRIVLVLYRE